MFARYSGQEIQSDYRRLRDLETEGHVMVYVTFVISSRIFSIAIILLLFGKVVSSYLTRALEKF